VDEGRRIWMASGWGFGREGFWIMGVEKLSASRRGERGGERKRVWSLRRELSRKAMLCLHEV
jgi:hypothetical protein